MNKKHNEIMVHTMAERVLGQMNQGKSQEMVGKDLAKSKEALVLAQRAYYDKDPEAIQFLQLDADVNNGEQEKIIIESEETTENLEDEIQLQESETDQLGISPSQEEDDI